MGFTGSSLDFIIQRLPTFRTSREGGDFVLFTTELFLPLIRLLVYNPCPPLTSHFICARCVGWLLC